MTNSACHLNGYFFNWRSALRAEKGMQWAVDFQQEGIPTPCLSLTLAIGSLEYGCLRGKTSYLFFVLSFMTTETSHF